MTCLQDFLEPLSMLKYVYYESPRKREQGTPHHPDFFELYSQRIHKASLKNEYTWEMLYAFFSLCKHVYTLSNLIAAIQKLLSWAEVKRESMVGNM